MATIVIDAYFLVTKCYSLFCRDVRQSCGDLDTDLIRNDESDLFKSWMLCDEKINAYRLDTPYLSYVTNSCLI